ncbi:MAG TPA: NlpC/P60 family protein [Aestuariivirga sp.]|nr:NlpC/P60 family protein [Aestuariivirga sp.]
MDNDRIVRLARGWLGTPYAHQASLKGVGCDCLGLLRGVWREAYGTEPEAPPPYAPDWAEAGADDLLRAAGERHLIAVDPAEIGPGAVLLFRWRPHLPAKHAAIAVSPSRMIHAQEGAVVSEVALSPWWRRRLAHVFRFPERDA